MTFLRSKIRGLVPVMKVGTEITDSGFCGIYTILKVRNASFNMIKS